MSARKFYQNFKIYQKRDSEFGDTFEGRDFLIRPGCGNSTKTRSLQARRNHDSTLKRAASSKLKVMLEASQR